MKKLLIALTLLLAVAASGGETPPKNIILFIGDGMGLPQLTAAKIVKGSLEMERCPVAGLMTTWNAKQLVTDSAAAATALACGVKTGNGTLGFAPDGTPLKNVFEHAKENGKAVGVAVTCALTHATPAGFTARAVHRNQTAEIAAQIAAGNADVLFGGGLEHFTASGSNGLDELRVKMAVALSAEEFRALGTPRKAAALLAPVHLPPASQRPVSLAEMTRKAIEILSQNEDGFFLMVEGSQIDWAGHQNDAVFLISETVDFDDAAGAGLDFAEKDGRTLVIITADHETGGFAVLDGSVSEQSVSKTGFVHGEHTASMVPLLAYGPGSRAFGGMLDIDGLGRELIRLVRLPDSGAAVEERGRTGAQ